MSLRMIPFNQLSKDKYQTPLNRRIIKRIKEDYHEDMVQPAIVSFRNGKYWIVDGQHRSQAKYELHNNDPNTPILCDVRTGLTYEQEADLFSRLNTGSRIIVKTDFIRAQIEAKDPVALDFRDTVESCGYVMYINTSNTLDAISTAWRIYNKKDGKETLTKILTLTNMCWPSNRQGVHSIMLNGLALFLKHHGSEFKTEQFVKQLSGAEPKTLLSDARTFYKNMDSKQFTQPYCMYTGIVNRYNKGIRNKLMVVLPTS